MVNEQKSASPHTTDICFGDVIVSGQKSATLATRMTEDCFGDAYYQKWVTKRVLQHAQPKFTSVM